tara:strand:+ start:142 stop:354 length:213 start_codon:yes stop_codon:yes gene_type:complete
MYYISNINNKRKKRMELDKMPYEQVKDLDDLRGQAYNLHCMIEEYYEKWGINTYDEFIEYLEESKDIYED